MNKENIKLQDQDSIKEGYWYEYDTFRIMTNESYRINPRVDSSHNFRRRAIMPLAKGYLKGNRKVGQWTFYKGAFFNDNYAFPTSHEQTVVFTDSGYFKIIDTFWHFYATATDDTNKLNGTLYLGQDKICITCIDKKCWLRNPFNKSRKEKFGFKYLDEYLVNLNFSNLRKERKKSSSQH